MGEKRSFIIVVGASAGGLSAVCQLAGQLKKELNAAVVIIQHLPEKGEVQHIRSHLMQKCTPLTCQVAAHGMPIRNGYIYLAPAGSHLLIEKKQFTLGKGPAEGWWRPSINASFRSAAVSWDSHCIGIILTGMLDDGAAGMEAIGRCGGFTIVQDPAEAEYPNMPLEVLRSMDTNECLLVSAMGKSIMERVAKNPAARKIPDDIRREALMAERASTSMDSMREFSLSGYSCPECGGALWEIEGNGVKRFRCHIGHAFTEKELVEAQDKHCRRTTRHAPAH